MKTVRSSVLYRIAALLFAVLFLLPILPRRYAPDAADAETAVSESAVPALRSGGSGSGLVSEGEAYQYVLTELLKRRTKTDGEGRLCSEISVRDYRLSEDYVRNQLCPLLFYSEAELFFLDTRGFSWTTSGGEVQSLIFHYADGVDAEIAASMLAEFRDLTAAIVAGADPSWSEWEKIAYVHDYIALHYGYDQRALSEETKDLAVYDAYRMLKEGIGVCQAYSLLTRYLLKRLGVACECVSCHELNHEWNLVKIGGSWYHIDVTWDDWDDKGLYGQVSHAYFLSSDAAFDDGGHHSNSGWASPAPATNGKYDGFFSDVTTPFVFAPGAIYAINGDKLVKYDPDEEERRALAEQITEKSLSVRQAEEAARRLARGRKTPPPPARETFTPEVDYAAIAARDLGNRLGRRVKIVNGKRKGRLELEYYGMDDLNDLLDALSALPARD